MTKIREAFKKVTNTITGGIKGRPSPFTPKAGVTASDRRYKCGGKLRKKK